jgi:hypothetical protein
MFLDSEFQRKMAGQYQQEAEQQQQFLVDVFARR